MQDKLSNIIVHTDFLVTMLLLRYYSSLYSMEICII